MNTESDALEMTTLLAEEYLKNTNIQEIPKVNGENVPTSILFKMLAKKIMEHEELFCQLEYLKRKIPADDTKKNLKLIKLNLLYDLSTEVGTVKKLSPAVVKMLDNTPLAMLGLVSQFLSYRRSTTVIATTQAVATCYFFTELCHEVGLGDVTLLIRTEEENSTSEFDNMFKTYYNSTGVITESSNINLAVATFLSSSSTCFWRLRRILVEESVFEPFRKAFATITNAVDELEILKNGNTQVFVYQDKIFWINYSGQEGAVYVVQGGDSATRPQVIYVRAYRTSQELLALIAEYNAAVVSLWTSNITEANDIARGIGSALVWVNDFGKFDGPPAASQWLYNSIRKFLLTRVKVSNLDEEKETVVKAWRKYDKEMRLNKIYNVLEAHRLQTRSVDILKLQERVQKFKTNQAVYFISGNMWITLDLPTETIFCYRRPCHKYDDLIGVFQLLVAGNAVMVESFSDLTTEPVLQALQSAGIPVFYSSAEEHGRKHYNISYTTRVILLNLKVKTH